MHVALPQIPCYTSRTSPGPGVEVRFEKAAIAARGTPPGTIVRALRVTLRTSIEVGDAVCPPEQGPGGERVEGEGETKKARKRAC